MFGAVSEAFKLTLGIFESGPFAAAVPAAVPMPGAGCGSLLPICTRLSPGFAQIKQHCFFSPST